MAKTKISEYDSNPANNTDINGIDIAEGCAPSGINNAIRTLMSDLKEFQDGSSGDSFTTSTLNATTVDTTNLEVTNVKAKDGTSAISIADSTGVVTVGSLAYTGTLTGGTGVVNIGSGQLYKTSAGLFGIGTTSPSDRVHLYGSQQVVRIESSSSTDALVRTKTTLGDWGAGTGIDSAANSWSVYNYGTSTRPFSIDEDNMSKFERAAEGNAALFISNAGNTDQGGQIELRNSYPSGNPQSKFFRVNNSGFFDIVNNAYSAVIMSVTDAGAAFQGNNSSTWSVSSDERIKTNKRSINDALGKIKSLQPCHFEYKNAIGKTRTGFIAQEFEQTFPGHVTEATAPMEFHDFIDGDDKTIKSIDANLVPYLVAAIKELSAQVDQISAELNSLKSQ